MYKVELYLKVRQACLVEGRSQRSVALFYGLNRRTVEKMLKYAIPPGYRRKQIPHKPKLSRHIDFIDAVIKQDKTAPRKQRHTARRIYNRLKEERGFDGGYTIVREYVARARANMREMFVPLCHDAGKAQVDFGESQVVLGGVQHKVHLFIMDIPQSDGCFVKAYLRENTESFCDGHVSAFEFFRGVPLEILYDNTKIAVSKILGNGQRVKTKAFTELQSHYLFNDHFARIGKGNDKGKVENLVGYARRNFMVPLPEVDSIEALNCHLLNCCVKRQEDIIGSQRESIGERLRRDQKAFRPLPDVSYEACFVSTVLVSCESLVSFKGNFYSVPVRYGYQHVTIKGYVDRVDIFHMTETIASHDRLYGKGEYAFNPLHYLPLLERKVGAFEQAAPLKGWSLPTVFERLKKLLYKREGKAGIREYIKILRLLSVYEMSHVAGGIHQGIQMGVLSYDGIKHLVLCQVEEKPPRLNLLSLPAVPSVRVAQTKVSSYQQLMGGVA